MKALRLWQGVRMRQVAARPEPDSPARLVTLPVSWDDRAAEALAALVPGEGAVSLAAAASVWIGMAASRARQSGSEEETALALHSLLLQRRAAPNAAIWRCETAPPGFSLNAAGFHDASEGYDVAGFAQAAGLAARTCQLIAPGFSQVEIGLTGLDDLLARLGLAYDSRAARALGAALACLLRASVAQALEGDQPDLLATGADWPPPPRHCPLPGLAEAAAAAREKLRLAPGQCPATGIFPAGPQDALLGVETGGIAPAFSPVRDRHLTRAAQHRLAASAMSPEAALAAVLEGESPLPSFGADAHLAMHQAVAPYLQMMPALPEALPSPAAQGAVPGGRRQAAAHERLPSRHGGLTQKVSVGGHRLFLRTAEYADGRLGEIAISLPRETPSVRCLAECVAQAVSLGLQHGVPLEDFVEAFTLTRFSPAGVVEGDPDVDRATSILDYVFRTLSANYLGRVLPEPPLEQENAGPAAAAPLLPLDLPPGRTRRRSLRLVA